MVYKMLTIDWKAHMVGLVTDAAGEARKAKRLFGEIHPEIAVLDCYAHQVSYISISGQ
jgi:hypothetical protein